MSQQKPHEEKYIEDRQAYLTTVENGRDNEKKGNENSEAKEIVANKINNIEEIAMATIKKKQELEELLKTLDSDEVTYPSAKTLFSEKEDSIKLAKNVRNALHQYGVLLAKFSDLALQCDNVVELQNDGSVVEQIDKDDEVRKINEDLTAKQTFVSKIITEISELDQKIKLERDNDRINELTLEKKALEVQKILKQKEITDLEKKINELQAYVEKAKTLLELKDFEAEVTDDIEKQNIIEFFVESLVKRGTKRVNLYLEKKINNRSYKALNSNEAQKLIKNKMDDVNQAKEIIDEKDKQSTRDTRLRLTDRKVLNNLYDTIGEGRFRVFITVIDKIIGKDGLFPDKKSVVDAVSGENTADELATISKTNNQESNANFVGGILSAIGEIGADSNSKDLVSEVNEAIAEYGSNQTNTDNQMSKEDLDSLSDASFNAIKKVGDTLSSVSDDLDYFSEGDLKEENINTLSSLNVKERGSDSNVELKDDRTKHMKFAKTMRGISAITKVVNAGSDYAGDEFGKLDNKKAEKISNTISYGSKVTGNIADIAANASEMVYYKGNINKLQKQTTNILSHLNIKDHESNDRKNKILNVLKGSNSISKINVAPSNKTKKKLDVSTALDEMQTNNKYKLSNAEKKKLSLAAATSRACFGIQYKSDVLSLNLAGNSISATALNLVGSSISAISNTARAVANLSSMVSPVLSIPFLFAGAISKVASTVFNAYSKTIIEKKKKIKDEQLGKNIRDEQLGKNISSMMKVLFNMKDSNGNLPTLKVLDDTVVKTGGEIKYSDNATLDDIDQAENSVAAFNLLTGAGIDIDGIMVAAVKGTNVKNNSKPTGKEDELDMIDLNKDDKDESYYKKLILSKLANI